MAAWWVKAFGSEWMIGAVFTKSLTDPSAFLVRHTPSNRQIMKRLMCVWLPNWPIQRLRKLATSGDSPDPTSRPDKKPPIVLWDHDPRRGRLVVACCRASVAMGVRIAMPIAQASEMTRAGGCQPRIEQHDSWLDQETLGQIATLLQENISPLVAIEMLDDHPWAGHPLHQPESLLSDISGIAHLFAGEIGLLHATKELLATIGLVGRMAIADSVGAAWALAHYAKPYDANAVVQQDRSVDGFIAPHGTSRQQIASLPVESLRIAPATVATLRRLGIEGIDSLLQLPKSGLATRLGKTLVRRIDQATGEIDEPLTVHRQPADHCYTLELEYPTCDQRILADRVGKLIEKARAGLATCNRGALRFTCRLDLTVHPPLTFEIGLFAPTLDVHHLTGLMINQVENKKLPSCVVRITISVTLTGPLRSSQTSLFKNDSYDANTSANWMSGSAVCRLVDALSGRLGRDAVLGVMMSDDPLPENGFHVWPLTGNKSMAKKKPMAKKPKTFRSRRPSESSRLSAPGHDLTFRDSSRQYFNAEKIRHSSDDPSPEDAMRRPLSLLVRPIPLQVENGSSLCSSDHWLPDHFRLDGVNHRIVRYWGPERIETGWWKGPSVRRDYYRIETDRGLWWWIFRELVSKAHDADTKNGDRWMLHGRFS